MPVYLEDANDPPFKQVWFKQVCTYYGLTMYMVQVLEYGLVNALVWLDLHPRTLGHWTPEEFDAFYKARFAETLSILARHISRHAVISQDLKSRLGECDERRYFLAHHFFVETVDDVESGDAARFIERLIEDRDYFCETDRILDESMEPVLLKLGLTAEYRDEHFEAYNSLVRPKPGIR
jgi:hypothetical protein